MKSNASFAANAPRTRYPFGASVAHGLRHPLVPSADAAASLERARLDNMRLRRRQVSMASVIDQCVETMGPFVRGRGQSLSVSVAPGPMELDADAARLCQVLQHLIVNASKFNTGGAEVGVHVRRDHGEAVVVITDTGIGIHPERIGSIFELYLKRHATSSTRGGGLGIGLHVARALIEAHGGTLTATSEGVGLGSAFTLRLPCLGVDSEASALLQSSPRSRSVSALTAA